jgi:hypothetical protein
VEVVIRKDFVARNLPAPSKGIGHSHLDLKLAQLRTLSEKEGHLDCILVGPSTVAVGINPIVFMDTFRQMTGQKIIVYNFGVGGLSINSTSVLIKILLKLYRPKIIVLGVLPIDFQVEKRTTRNYRRIVDNPWIRHQLGEFNITGWITDNLLSYQYFLLFRQWMEQPKFYEKVKKKEKMLINGFWNFSKRKKTAEKEVIINKQHQRFKQKLENFIISKQRIADFERIVSFGSKVGLVIVEMPTQPLFKTFYKNGVKDHLAGIMEIERRAKGRNVLFIPTPQSGYTSHKMWNDTIHMSSDGAKKYSQWLGNRIGQEVNKGRIKIILD